MVLAVLVLDAALYFQHSVFQAVVIFEVLLNATAIFNHGNVRMPLWLDRWLRLIVVTPDMHRVRH